MALSLEKCLLKHNELKVKGQPLLFSFFCSTHNMLSQVGQFLQAVMKFAYVKQSIHLK